MMLYAQPIAKEQNTVTTSSPFTQKFILTSVKKDKGKAEQVFLKKKH